MVAIAVVELDKKNHLDNWFSLPFKDENEARAWLMGYIFDLSRDGQVTVDNNRKDNWVVIRGASGSKEVQIIRDEEVNGRMD